MRSTCSRQFHGYKPNQDLRGLVRLFKILTVAFAVLVLAEAAKARPRDQIAPEEVDLRLSELRMPAVDFSTRPKESIVDGYSDCVEHSAELLVREPDGSSPRKQTVSIWLPDSLKGPKPAVIIVPTIEGRWFVEDRAASWLCSAGIVAVIADVNDTGLPKELPDWGFEDRRMRAAMLSLQTVLDWATTDSRIDADRIGSIGISLGAITTALWAGIEPRLKAGMIVAGGGNLPEILALSAQSKVSELRRKRMRAAGLKSAKEYEEALHKAVRFDPLFFAARSKSRHKLITGTADDAVPVVSQESLWESLGKPERLLIEGDDHVGSIVTWAYGNMGDSVAWFKAKLAL